MGNVIPAGQSYPSLRNHAMCRMSYVVSSVEDLTFLHGGRTAVCVSVTASSSLCRTRATGPSSCASSWRPGWCRSASSRSATSASTASWSAPPSADRRGRAGEAKLGQAQPSAAKRQCNKDGSACGLRKKAVCPTLQHSQSRLSSRVECRSGLVPSSTAMTATASTECPAAQLRPARGRGIRPQYSGGWWRGSGRGPSHPPLHQPLAAGGRVARRVAPPAPPCSTLQPHPASLGCAGLGRCGSC